MMASQSRAAEELLQYVEDLDGDEKALRVPEGAFKSWLPRVLYTYSLDTIHLPFLRLFSFPVGGTALGSLTSMRIFHAVGNYLYSLPSSFVECRLIVSLDLSFNHFTEIPQPVFSLVNLQELNFAHNDIEQVGSGIGDLVNLQVLNLGGNTLDSLPEPIANCSKIQKLDLSGTFYPRGRLRTVPDGVCALVELTELDLSWQKIECIPDEFGNLVLLEKLNLKGNHLQNVSLEMRNCVKLRSVNLAGALRYCSEIPKALFGLEDLQSLNLSDNFFTEIPEEVMGLGQLTVLVIQRNALLRLPDSLFHLQQLNHLELSENYLEALPAGVGNLNKLTYLGLDRNHLTELPDELCKVKSLVTLTVSANKLTRIPEKIHQLSSLHSLSLENNQLKELPLLLDRLEGLVETSGLSLHDNYLRIPPQAICDQGVVPLFHFLKELRVSEATHRCKMILIGAVKAGKTSLRHALMWDEPKINPERTCVLERHLWEPESMLRVQILDFGGHHIYQAAHHMFLTPEALHLLVFDLSCYRPELFDECISHWLDAIMDRAPGATILLVGTHVDLCTAEEVQTRCSNVVEQVQREETAKLKELQNAIRTCREQLDQPEKREAGKGRIGDLGVERLKDKLNYLERMQNTRCKIPDRVHVVSCASDLTGMDDLRQELVTIIQTSEKRKLPSSWYKFLSDIQDESARILSMEQALETFKNVMTSLNQSLMSMGGSADRSLAMVLKYLQATGEIVWFHDNPRLDKIVFHRPETLIQMLRSVLRHDFEQVVHFDPELGRTAGIAAFSRFKTLKDDFVHRGFMTYELLHFTLLQFQLSSDALDTFISLMLKFDLCCEVTNDSDPSRKGAARVLQFPWFFPEDRPPNLSKTWPQQTPANTFELRFEAEFPRRGPPYFFEKLSVRLQQYVSDRQNWKYGVFAHLNHSTLLVTRRYDNTNDCTIITVAARGATDLQELWYLLKQTRAEMLQLLQDWPFVQPSFSLICSHCLLHRYPDPYTFPGEVLDEHIGTKYFAHWCRNHPDDRVPVCFIYPLDKDYQDDIQKHMQAATDFLQSVQDSVDGPVDLLSEAGLSFIATRLGLQWTHLMYVLGMRAETVEQIEMSFINNPYRQILEGLRVWSKMPVRGIVRDAGDTREGKIQQLLQALGSDGIENFELVEVLKVKFHLTTDG